MSDATFWMVSLFSLGVMTVLTLAVYIGLRTLEIKYRDTVEKIRKIYATYSVPIFLALMFGLSFYFSKKGYICDAAGHNTAGWTCNLSWFLFPLLIISVAISYHYWRVYRKNRDFWGRITAEDPGKLPRWRDTYSRWEIIVTVILLLAALVIYLLK